MRRYFSPIVLLLFLLLPQIKLQADVVITNDDMILNGKILEDKKDQYINFANYHGNFTIKYKQIKEIYRTESFWGDIEFLKKRGKSVNENEVKNNYLSGEKKLKILNKKNAPPAGKPKSLVLMFDLFYNKNYGKIESVLPYSTGFALSGEAPVDNIEIFKKLHIYGIDSEICYFYSEKDKKYIKSIIASAGPLWKFSVTTSGYSYNFNISAEFGLGWYFVKNAEAEESSAKWNLTIHAGPAFDVYSIIISPQLRIDYIYDGYAPLLSTGFSLGAGYRF